MVNNEGNIRNKIKLIMSRIFFAFYSSPRYNILHYHAVCNEKVYVTFSNKFLNYVLHIIFKLATQKPSIAF